MMVQMRIVASYPNSVLVSPYTISRELDGYTSVVFGVIGFEKDRKADTGGYHATGVM